MTLQGNFNTVGPTERAAPKTYASAKSNRPNPFQTIARPLENLFLLINRYTIGVVDNEPVLVPVRSN
jgi:hypothetical protein